MSKTSRPSPAISDAEWTVRHAVAVSEWDATTDPCPTCGDPVDRLEPHYQIELDRERTPTEGEKLTRERRLLAFCDGDCADAWLNADR